MNKTIETEEVLLEKYQSTSIQITEAYKDKDGLWWGYFKGKLVELFYLSEDETRAEAYCNGMRPTNVRDGNDVLHIELET